MKDFAMIVFTAGTIAGTIGTGICVYLTGSIFSSLISLSCTISGGWIGKSMSKKQA